jgi:hypothetical protein
MRFAVFFRPRLARAVLIQAQQVALKFRAVKRLDQRFQPLDHRAVASGSYYFWRSRFFVEIFRIFELFADAMLALVKFYFIVI